jgi:thiol-disulfide isomerase/thioredoxin
MRTQIAARLLVGMSLVLTGCGKCCDTTEVPASSTSASVTSSSQPASEEVACCDVGPTRVAVLTKPEQVELKAVKLAQLEDAIKAQAGKIVVMDVWGTFCVPCKKEFPRLVKLHERFAKRGLVCMSLSIDEKEDRDAALEFLKSRHATFANFIMDEPAMAWQEHFLLKGVPAVFIWDRSGKQIARFDGDDPDNQFTYADVEKKVAELFPAK